MWNNPILRREIAAALRTKKTLGAIVALAIIFAALVALRWPTDARVDLTGVQSQEVFRLFGYGLLTAILTLAPVFPAVSIVRERQKGTLTLLLNSPTNRWAIYGGKLMAFFGLSLLMMAISLPAAAACFAMGGVSPAYDILPLYAVLALAALQCCTLALLVSISVSSMDAAIRTVYGCILLLAVVSLGPHLFLQGQGGYMAAAADWLRCLSPISATMTVLGQAGTGGQGIISATDVVGRFFCLSLASSAVFAGMTLSRLNHSLFDRSRAQGVITQDRSLVGRSFRRMVYLVDPQRRAGGIGPLVNPVMIKEFRCRRFGRLHWLLRLAAVSAFLSLLLTYAVTMGTFDWGTETIGGVVVLLQAALIVLLAPSLAAGLISTEVESGGWQLLQMTPLSAGKILRGKLASVVWPVLLILLSTIPGYLVMVYIQPEMWLQVRQILFCLGFTALFSISLSFAASSLFTRTAVATTVAYAALILICGGTLLVWLMRDAPFGHVTVETALKINPVAPALAVIETPGFTQYSLLPDNWWFCGMAAVVFTLVVLFQTRRLVQPQ